MSAQDYYGGGKPHVGGPPQQGYYPPQGGPPPQGGYYPQEPQHSYQGGYQGGPPQQGYYPQQGYPQQGYPAQAPPQTIYVQQQPESKGAGSTGCMACLAGICLCCCAEEICDCIF